MPSDELGDPRPSEVVLVYYMKIVDLREAEIMVESLVDWVDGQFSILRLAWPGSSFRTLPISHSTQNPCKVDSLKVRCKVDVAMGLRKRQ